MEEEKPSLQDLKAEFEVILEGLEEQEEPSLQDLKAEFEVILEGLEEQEEPSDSDILNDIENRIREDKPVLKREIDLLLECYCTYGVMTPKDIKKKLMKGGFI